MLQNLHIKNIILIDEIDISFEEGLNILTGETGAGKSIIIGSLAVGLGGKFQKDILRDNEKDGLIELLFSIEQPELLDSLKEMELPIGEDGELLISRRLSSSGRAVNRVNEHTVTTARLQEVAALLIDLHAQHEQQTLLKADKHLEILDRFGGDEIDRAKQAVKELYEKYTMLESEIDMHKMDETEKNKRMDFLQYQIQEIRAAALCDGEEETLQKQYQKCVHAKEIIETAGEIYQMTGYDFPQSAAEQIGHALSRIGRLAELDSDLSGAYDILHDIDGMMNDFNRELKGYMDDMTFDEKQFSDITERLDLIHNLQSKYGKTISEILEKCDRFEKEYQELITYEELMQNLHDKLQNVDDKLREASVHLHNIRSTYAVNMCAVIKEALEELNFTSVMFDMQFEQLPRFTANGIDKAYFMISTNVGEHMRPLYEVASGGELSRVMLAIKSCLAYADDTPTLLFDEIDVGISGRTAQRVAEKLSVIAKRHQVLCITHLPQIAAMADVHYLIDKTVENKKTITTIKMLDGEASIGEIARLLGGATITENTIASAREMKGLAKGTKIY
ncbi:MAG: DNA repair protein RecN [Lachnospiraceae bacterium]|nr:DNA repair protein RecN [Lachnospiraceae bacterium]